MGKLIRLELFNFKSYKGHHVLLFGDSYFTSIIGPNGSGKSNSMDAISFVLGIKSSHLRSTHLRDLVYRGRVLKTSRINADGTATEVPEGEPQDTEAESGAQEEEQDTQTSTQRPDPTNAWVMAVYEDDAGDEQAWKRSITATGQSEYRINNRLVSAKQYNEALEAENILIKARNFLVFQGDVEAIASQSSKDLTRLIEQISGSLEYKADYDRLKIEAEKAAEDQAFRLNQRRGINSEIKQYQEQKREVDSYNRKADEKDQAVVTHVLWKLYHFQQMVESSGAEIQKHQDELKEYRRNVEAYEARLAEAQQEQARAGREVHKLERNIKNKEKAVEEKENDLLPINEKISLSNKKLEATRKRITEISKERDAQSRNADQLKKDLEVVQRAQSRWEQEWSAAQQQAGRELSEADLQEYNRLRGEVNKRTAADQIKVDNITRQLKTDEETVESLKSKVDSTENHISKLDSEVSTLRARRDELTSTIRSINNEADSKKKEFNTLTSERLRSAQKHTEIEEKLQEVLHKLNDASVSQRESEKETRARETVAAMKRIFPGVRGQLWSLCKPKQKKYNVAVSTVLGRHNDSIVVDTEKVAKECIQYLRDQRAGQATFIPLDTIMHKAPDANLKGMHRGMRLAIDTIDYENAVERAISFACGNSIVCDDLQIARYLCYDRRVEAKAVTLDGTIIHKGGLMTGGHGSNDQRNARKWEDSEVENLRRLKDKLLADLSALPKGHRRQAEEEALQGELAGLESRRAFADEELKALESNIESKRRELNFARRQLEETRPKYEEQAQGVTTLRSQLESYSSSVATVEDEVFAAFCQRLGYSDIRAYEAQQGSAQQEAAQKKLEFTTQRSRLENQLAFETQRLQTTKDRIAKLQSDVREAQANIANLESERDNLNNELDELNAEVEQMNEQLITRRTKYDEKSDKVAEHRREVAKRSKSIEDTNKDITALQEAVQRSNSDRYSLLRRCRIEEINIPLTPQSRKLETLPLDGGMAADEDAMDVDEEDGSQRVPGVNDYGIDVDFSDLDDDLKQDDSEQCEANLQEIVSNIQADLDKMAPNMRAIERLEGVEARLKSTDDEFEASRKAAKEAKDQFDDIRDLRSELFNKAYEHISGQIDQVYKELTRTASFPLGGQAYLDLEDTDEPYLSGIKYHAMPPLKRFRDMEHLSGGEKTMAALALLFAIHTYAPSPFFVLDEVDAALDNANTARLANYVKEHAGPGMQFVVISLKTGLFQNSETLVGVMRDQTVNSSRTLTMDLRKYQAA
ncbi:cohesin complex subunit Psm1, partial [Aureobasidium melanogenum]